MNMKMYVLLSDEGTMSCACDAGYGRTAVGGLCGTIVQIFHGDEEAKKALKSIEEASKEQRDIYDLWAKRSHEEPFTSEFMEPVQETSNNKYVRAGGMMIARTRARDKWVEKNPVPPTNLFQRFWLVECTVS